MASPSPDSRHPGVSPVSGGKSLRELDSVGAFLQSAVAKFGPAVALRRRRQPMQWSVVTWTELGAKVRDIGAGLIHLGVKQGDRVALLSRTRLEWSLVDYAILSVGAVTVPLYHSATPLGIRAILEDSGADVLVVEDRGQLERVQANVDALGTVRKIIVIDVMDLRERDDAHLLEELEELRLGRLHVRVVERILAARRRRRAAAAGRRHGLCCRFQR